MAAPLRVTVTPLPSAAGVTAPETLAVDGGVLFPPDFEPFELEDKPPQPTVTRHKTNVKVEADSRGERRRLIIFSRSFPDRRKFLPRKPRVAN